MSTQWTRKCVSAPASAICYAKRRTQQVPTQRLHSGSAVPSSVTEVSRLTAPAPAGRALRTIGSWAVTIVPRDRAAGVELAQTSPGFWSLPPSRPASAPQRAAEAPLRRSCPRKPVSPRALPNGGRSLPRVFPKHPDASPSPERAEGAYQPRPPEPLRKGPKFAERPSCRTAGGGRSAMLDALLAE